MGKLTCACMPYIRAESAFNHTPISNVPNLRMLSHLDPLLIVGLAPVLGFGWCWVSGRKRKNLAHVENSHPLDDRCSPSVHKGPDFI